MTNDVIWLIVLAFFFARGFVSTGLGDRIATMFVEKLGKSTLGLSYGLSISEAVLKSGDAVGKTIWTPASICPSSLRWPKVTGLNLDRRQRRWVHF